MWRQRLRALSASVRGMSLQKGGGGEGGGGGRRSTARLTMMSAGAGLLVGTGYSVYTHYKVNGKSPLPATSSEHFPLLKNQPPYKPHFTVESRRKDALGSLQLVLFQYGTCPFCCKVRAYLDAKGIGYELVEVDAVLRQAIKWSDYKKVPMVIVKVNGGYQQLYDSTAIISVLESLARDEQSGDVMQRLEQTVAYYPVSTFSKDDGATATDVVNKYFVMNQASGGDNSYEIEERKWRQWADQRLVHLLSPNVYRTLGEAYRTFDWFADTARWRELFPAWEVSLMVNVGAVAMWLISKRLKARHGLEDDVRSVLYRDVAKWCAALETRGQPFLGGSEPGLADLAVYGVLSSIEGCSAFTDLRQHTRVGGWYDRVAAAVAPALRTRTQLTH